MNTTLINNTRQLTIFPQPKPIVTRRVRQQKNFASRTITAKREIAELEQSLARAMIEKYTGSE
jgi:hypothetical protein